MSELELIDAEIDEQLEICDAEIASRGMYEFTKHTFQGRFRESWHHKVVCEELDNWIDSVEPYNLMLFMPPRHSKSEIASRHLPPYLFGKDPNAHILFASYNSDLAGPMSRDAQKVMLTDEYARVFPETRLVTRGHKVKKGDRDIKQALEFTIVGYKGTYRASGVGGSFTGRGADFGIIDDPVKDRKDAESETVRDSIWDWYRSTFRTRLQKGGRILLLMTRWHNDDLAARLINQMKDEPDSDKWRIVSLPAVAEDSEYKHPDDTRLVGEALWEDEFPASNLKKIRATVGPYDWRALYQQMPTAPGGAVIKREWLQVIDEAPLGLVWVRYWDLAVTKKTSADYTASGQMAIDVDGNVYVGGFVREQEEWPPIKRMITTIALQELCRVGIEQVGTQKGFVQSLVADDTLRGVNIRGYGVDSDKKTRALPWVARAAAGKFFLIREKGLDKYIAELVNFTGVNDKHDDQVDWTSGAYSMLVKTKAGIDIIEYSAEELQDGVVRESRADMLERRYPKPSAGNDEVEELNIDNPVLWK